MDSDEADDLTLVSRVALACLGPQGSVQGVQANPRCDVGTLSSNSRRLFESIKLKTWLARALVRLAVQPQVEAFGDGGLLAAAIAATLVEAVNASARSPLDRFYATRSLDGLLDGLRSRLKVDLALEIDGVEGAVRPIRELDWSDMGSLVALARGVVSSKQKLSTTSEEVDHVCTTLAKAFVLALPESASFKEPHIGLVTITGPSASETFATSNIVLDIPISHQTERMLPIAWPTILVFNTGLDVDLERNEQQIDGVPAEAGGVRLEYQGDELRSQGEAKMSMELSFLSDLVRRLAADKISVVACQKTIHPFIKQELAFYGIVPIERVSLRHIDAVADCCGARPISTLAGGAASLRMQAGALKRISVRRLRTKPVIILEPAEDRSMQTVVLTAPNEFIMKELAACCRSVFSLFTAALRSPFVIPGGGCLELILSRLVRIGAASSPLKTRKDHVVSNILERFAKTLEDIGLSLSRGHLGLGSGETASQRLAGLFKTYGSSEVLDLVLAKLAAIEFAIEAACTLSRVDCTLVA